MNTRRSGGRETWHRLLEWDKGQPDSERLAARLLSTEGYDGIDPSHPLGGRDGGKDALCRKDGHGYVLAVYFARGHKDFREIGEKFQDDLAKAKTLEAEGIVFFTNQELSLAERRGLCENAAALDIEADVFHLERIAMCAWMPRRDMACD